MNTKQAPSSLSQASYRPRLRLAKACRERSDTDAIVASSNSSNLADGYEWRQPGSGRTRVRAPAGAHARAQAPSDHPEFAEFLVTCGIDSISVSPDSFVAVKRRVAAAEARLQETGSGAIG